MTQLLAATERRDWQDHNLRGQAYEAVNMLIQNHARDMRPVVLEVMQVVLQRLHSTFSTVVVSQDDKEERYQLQSLLCSVMQVITRAVDKDIEPFCDHIVALLLQVLNNEHAIASEEAFMALGAIASTVVHAYAKYMGDFFPFLQNARLRNLDAGARLVLRVATCLLYTSDAADDKQCVSLGGRGLIKNSGR